MTEAPEDPGEVGGLLALVIKEGDPDGVALVGNDADAASCSELLESIPAAGLTDPSRFTDVEAGSDIENEPSVQTFSPGSLLACLIQARSCLSSTSSSSWMSR